MNPNLFQLGAQVAAIATIVGGAGLLVLGRSTMLGQSCRLTIKPMLTWVRSRSELSRSDLAEISTLLAVALALLGGLVDQSPTALVLAVLLWMSRPSIVRLTRDEHPLMAEASSFTIDLMIGIYVPIAVAQILLVRLPMAGSFVALIVALSWPAGGAATRRRLRLAGIS